MAPEVKMRRSVITMTLLMALLPAQATAKSPPDASELVADADRVRFPDAPFRVRTTVTELVRGGAQREVQLDVMSKKIAGARQFSTLARYVAPTRDADKAVLFAGARMWYFDPRSRGAIRISPQQRLIGQAANGDVATVNLSVDYAARLVGEETLLDAEQVERRAFRLDLRPRSDGAVYGRIELWVDSGNHRPIKSRFYAASGLPLKVAYYAAYAQQMGALRPTRVFIIDAVNTDLVTKISYSNLTPEAVPDAWFQPDYMGRLK